MQLEEVLMMADIGAATTGEIIDDLRAVAKEDQLDPDDVKSVLRGRLIDALSVKGRAMNLARQEGEAEDQVRRIGTEKAFSQREGNSWCGRQADVAGRVRVLTGLRMATGCV